MTSIKQHQFHQDEFLLNHVTSFHPHETAVQFCAIIVTHVFQALFASYDSVDFWNKLVDYLIVFNLTLMVVGEDFVKLSRRGSVKSCGFITTRLLLALRHYPELDP